MPENLFFLRILWKPAFFYPFLLLEKLFNAPEGGEHHHADDGGKKGAFDEKGEDREDDAKDKKNGPRLFSNVIFRFDHDGMKNTDDEKRD